MKTTNFKFLIFLLAGSLFYTSCKKEDTPPVVEEETAPDGLYVLNEGLWGAGNTTLTYYNIETKVATTDFFFNKNGSDLGDTGNDIIKYGAKLYIVMNVSSYVEVTNLAGTHVKKIDFKDAGGAARQPRYAVGYKNKVLVSSFDGTVAVIDTASLTVDKFITVGSNPEQMAVSGDKLFVANSGGLNAAPLPFDSTVSVIDLASYTETYKIKVAENPRFITTDNNGNIYVSCSGNYRTGVDGQIYKINAFTNAIINSKVLYTEKIQFFDGAVHGLGYDPVTFKPVIQIINSNTLAVEGDGFITDATNVVAPYSISFDAQSGDVYITDAKDYTSSGEVFSFDRDGKKKFSFMTTPGLNPNKVIIIR